MVWPFWYPLTTLFNESISVSSALRLESYSKNKSSNFNLGFAGFCLCCGSMTPCSGISVSELVWESVFEISPSEIISVKSTSVVFKVNLTSPLPSFLCSPIRVYEPARIFLNLNSPPPLLLPLSIFLPSSLMILSFTFFILFPALFCTTPDTVKFFLTFCLTLTANTIPKRRSQVKYLFMLSPRKVSFECH